MAVAMPAVDIEGLLLVVGFGASHGIVAQ